MTSEDIERLNQAREAEPIAPEDIPMDISKMEGQSFMARVHDIQTTSEYILDENGQPLKEKGKHPHVACLLDTDFMDEGQYYTWKWRVSNSKNGTHAKVLQALSTVKIMKADGTDTGKRGIKGLTSINQLMDQTFRFERQDLEFGKQKDGTQMVKGNFPMPIEYYLPPEETKEEKKE